ncbi:MAG: prepilin-type N-terminal cleavage/methylation domain-containing protein [Deltaproteobacteria bacterium]|jgi:prepilin-type N-terminal cleavage/methylation domain-containing protein|nr:prepilin-type N-terminal cleavage/methylation domain-containing protein [Deltaproteobacteria bacterium]
MTILNNWSNKHPVGCRQGLTLVELLTVMLLGAILISMALLIYVTTSRSYMRQDSLVEQMMNLRSSMAFITRDLRMAGNGFSLLEQKGQGSRILVYVTDSDGNMSWFRNDPGEPELGVRPIWFNGSDTGPDVLTVAYLAPEFSAPLGVLAADFSAGSTQVRLDSNKLIEYPDTIDPKEILAPGDNIAIVAMDKAVILESLSDADDMPNISVAPSPNNFGTYMSGPFPANSLVYNVRRINVHSFRIENDNLVMDTLNETGEMMAEGIEDLQLGFAMGQDDPTVFTNLVRDLSSHDLGDPDRTLRICRLVLISKSTTRDPYNTTYPRIQALGHNPTGSDAYRRRALEAIVNLRNF